MKTVPTAFAAFLAASISVFAQAQTTPATPNRSQLDQERARIEAERKGMFAPGNPASQSRTGAMPSAAAIDTERRRIEAERKSMFDPSNPATRDAPNVFPLVPTPERGQIDLEALARRYEQKAQARRADGLMVFASFGMPAESLKRLITDTAAAGGAVVLRGFKDGSIKATAAAMTELGVVTGGVQINPNAFTKYRIKAVPAVVLVQPEGSELVDDEGCALPDKYVMVAGDVGLGYALDTIERRSPAFRDMAARYGRPLRTTTK